MDRARLATRLALIPLLVIALGFFLPPIVRELREAAVSPYEDGGWGALLIPPIHLTAFVLAVLSLVAGYRREAPGVASVVVAILAIVASGALLGVEVVAVGFDDGAAIFTLGAIGISVLTAAVVVVALRRTAWQRWVGLLAAYALAASYYGCPLYLGMFNLFSGGVVFILADVTLLVLTLRTLGPRAT